MSLLRIVSVAALVLNAAGTGMILAVSLLINADVIGRGAFAMPVNGVTEMASLALVAIVFLQVGAATTADKLTRSDVLPNLLATRRPRAHAMLEALFALLSLGFFIVLAVATYRPLLRAHASQDYVGVSGIITIPTWPVRAIILCSAILMCLTFAIRLGAALKAAFRPMHTADASLPPGAEP